ncbi:protein aurora borealis [Ceratina calcarata]|uniref:Protein aurora borealis n=1 Tax=Ceratina calcarata TaxID=156304 RepID=A0AAJ7J7V9_9HYME|nr:protein aurora borealis [Ceratina calcarata]
MEQLKWSTPIKSDSENENVLIKSPVIFKTPVRHCDRNEKHATHRNSKCGFSVLPSHLTPPSGLTKFIARNPFETDLTSRLHLSVISPTVFNKVSSPSQHSPDFAWSVDELAVIQPAKIDEFPVQQIYCTDPEHEIKAQAAINQFFTMNEIIPSPWELKRKDSRTKLMDSPLRIFSDSNSESSKSKKDGWSQTVLTLPSELPSDVMEVLKPYFTFTQEQNVDTDDANSSNSSLRRKLFFNNEDCVDNEGDSSSCLSPIEINESLLRSSNPPQSGMLAHGPPFKRSSTSNYDHDHPSPITTGSLSSPNISPIQSTINMSCESVRSRSRSVVRLDFTADMSVDRSSVKYKKLNHRRSSDVFLDKVDVQATEKKTDDYLNTEDASMCTQVEDTEVVANDSVRVERNFEIPTSEINLKYNANAFTPVTNTFESYVLQQTNGTLGISDRQSVSNCAQDTGYQTYSMSNVTDNTPTKQKSCWGDRVLVTDDEFRLSEWKENMKNIFSSTPSRSNRDRLF